MALLGRKWPFPITLASGLYNSLYYRTSRDIWFSYTRISYSICNFYGAIINHKGCFLFTPMQNDSLIRPIEKCFRGKKGKI